jgi:hypothetical protein
MVSEDGLEVLVELAVGDLVAELLALLGRVAEVEAEPDPCVDDLILDVVDAVEVLRARERAAAVLSARHRRVDVVGVQGGRERVGEGGGDAAVLGGVLGVARDPEQRLPGRVGGRVGIAVLVGVAPCRGPRRAAQLDASALRTSSW